MIKAIIFDCFGVLAENGWGLIDDKLKPTEDQWQQMMAVSHACDRGIISLQELTQHFADTLDVDVAQISKSITSQRKNYPLLELIKDELKPSYKIGLLSNVGSGFINGYFNSDELGLFDSTVLSSEVGYVKPDQRIYELAAAKLRVDISECLFIDDSPTNVIAAQQTGMQAFVYEDMTKLLADLANANIELAS